MRRKIITISAAALLTLTLIGWQHAHATASKPAVNYVASSVRLPFHRPDCKWAAKISEKSVQVFETREEAIAAGHRPCKVCQP